MDKDPTKLTSFQPLTPIMSSNSFSLSRFFDFGRRKANALTSTPEPSREGSPEPTQHDLKKERNVEQTDDKSIDHNNAKPDDKVS